MMALHTLSGVEEGGAARHDAGSARAWSCRVRRSARSRSARRSRSETFAHGALCMCYSGMCEMSAVIGGRSGNRGACAQPCRLRYGWHGEGGRESAVAQGREPRGVRRRDGGDGRGLSEARGAHEAARVCGGGDGHLCRAAARASRTDGGRTSRKRSALAFSRATGSRTAITAAGAGREMFGVRPDAARWPEEWFGTLRAAYEKEDMRLVPVRFRAGASFGRSRWRRPPRTATGIASRSRESRRRRRAAARRQPGRSRPVCARPAGRRSRCRTAR